MATPSFIELEHALTISGDIATDLQRQASLHYAVGVGAARWDSQVDLEKYNVSVVEAELQEAVRKAAAESGEKVTEVLIAGRVKSHADYKAAFQVFLSTQTTASEWKALLKSYDQRGMALHDLTLLSTRTGDVSGISNYSELRKASTAARRPLTKTT